MARWASGSARLAQGLAAWFTAIAAGSCSAGPVWESPPAPSPPPVTAPASTPIRLVVQITVDQLRADLFDRFADRYGKAGFRRFLDAGTAYRFAYYAHAITETAVGHATLFTGALPKAHGIVGNEWYDPIQKRRRFAVEDENHHWLIANTPGDGGTSPRTLRVDTIGDELRAATGGRALVYAISVKDRGAILPAGFGGKAIWFDDKSGDMVTSDYYFAAVPEFLGAFNAARRVDQYRSRDWQLLEPPRQYERRDQDDRSFEKSHKTLGRTFPHSLASALDADYFSMLKRTPFADELTLEVVETLMAYEPLGRDEVPDLLAISFSATDYVSHAFGPDSLEMEDNLLRLDRTLGRLFELLLARVGERELLVVLSSDHGGCDPPEALRAFGIDAGRHDPGRLRRVLNTGLAQAFGLSEVVVDFSNPTFWLDEEQIRRRGLSVEAVEREAAAMLLRERGVAFAITKTDLARGSLPRDPIHDRVLNSFDPDRTGNVYLVPEPGWLLASDPGPLTAMHGTPWSCDTRVPIALWGAGVRHQSVARQVDPRDIAVTLAAALRIRPPAGASGRTLFEAF